MKITHITEPLLLTSLLLLPISLMYFYKKYYFLAGSLFLNGIASYLYHYKKDYAYLNKKSDDKSDEEKYKKYLLFDVVISCISFVLSLYLAKKLSKHKKYKLLVILIIAFFFYILNYAYKDYNYHLAWHIFVLLGQLFLVLNVKTNKRQG